jgi:hypothetical protein
MTAVPRVAVPPDAAEVFVDADWIHDSEDAPCLYVRDGVLGASWVVGGGIAIGQLPAEEAAGRLLAVTAERAVSVVSQVTGPVEVVGHGAVALLAREGLRQPGRGPGAPAAIIDCSGDPDAIREGVRRLDDLGTLVLAGAGTPNLLEIDLYPDVHVRGLRLVGLGVDLDDEAVLVRGMLPNSLRTTLCEVGAGDGVEERCTWFRLRSTGD